MTDSPVIIAPENEELERALFDDHERAEAWQVFADWLSGQGDARGEAIALSFRGEEEALATYIAGHAERWLGALYPASQSGEAAVRPTVHVEWTHGVMSHVRLAHREADPLSGEEKLKALVALPAARLLRSLALGVYNFADENDYFGTVEILNDADLPGLRHLALGDFEEGPVWRSMVWEIDGYLRAFPDLTSLHIRSREMKASSLDHATLRSLALRSTALGPEMTALVGAAKLPQLEELEIWTGMYDQYGPLSDYRPLLAGETCPRLKHLRFRNAEQADAFVHVLAESALLPQLATVDLSLGELTPRGARVLIANKHKFAHLETLDVSSCCLGEEVVADLGAHFGSALRASGQRVNMSYAAWDQIMTRAEGDERMVREQSTAQGCGVAVHGEALL